MVVMEEKTWDGRVRRCDAKCYNAQHENCGCICQGENHGKGEDFAVKQMTVEEVLAEMEQE